MGLWDTLKQHASAQFLDVIEWLDDTNNTICYRFPVFNQAIQDGGRLVVREGQAAIFVNEGQLSDVFGPGTYELSTRTQAITSFFTSIKYQLNYPYKGDIYFVSTKQFTDQKWGTSNPFLMRDRDFGPTRVRAFGTYSFRVTDPAQFLRELVSTDGLFTTQEITGQLKRKLVSMFTDQVVSSGIGVLDLGSQFMEMGEATCGQMTPWFQSNYGLTLTDFTIENLSLPPKVEEALDKRTSMGVIGDMGAYTQFQTANAIEAAAQNPGGGAGQFMGAGMGFGMGHAMANQMAGAGQRGGQFNPQHGMTGPAGAAPPPPPAPGGPKLHYNGPSGQGQYTPQEIANLIGGNRAAKHHVWAPGWPGWKSWDQVPEVATLVPPAPDPSVRFHYNGPSGQGEHSVAEIVAKVRAAPSGRHLVWKQGFDGWKSVKDVPEIASALAGGGPPPPPGAPPPPPM